MNRNSKLYNRIIVGAVIWCIALAAVLMIVYGIPGIGGILNSTYVAKYDSVHVSDKVNCYLVKDEQITYSQVDGASAYDIKQDTHVRKYTQIMTVGSEAYTSDSAGIVSYTADGYEEFFSADNFINITEDSVSVLQISNQNLVKDQISAGDPIFKIVNDKEWYLVFWIEKKDIERYEKGNTVEVIIDDTHMINAEISDIYEQRNNYMVVLKSGEYYEDLAETRQLNVEVVLVDEQGLLIKQESIVTVDDQPGVYVKQLNGDYKFVRIKILTLADENAIVEAGTFSEMSGEVMEEVDTVCLYDEILRNPKSINKGGEKSE